MSIAPFQNCALISSGTYNTALLNILLIRWRAPFAGNCVYVQRRQRKRKLSLEDPLYVSKQIKN